MPTNYFVRKFCYQRKFCYHSLVAVELEPKQVSKIALFFFRLVIKRKKKKQNKTKSLHNTKRITN